MKILGRLIINNESMKTNERKTSVITEDAFKDSNDFTVNSTAICLDLTDKSLEDTKEYALIPHIFKFRVFESLKDVPNIPHKSWEYIYVIEVDNGKFIKVGYTKDVKKRLKTHFTDKDSPIAGRCKRIALLGPIRDGINTEQMIHNFMGVYYAKEDFPTTNELYSTEAIINRLPQFSQQLKDVNIFDLFCGTSDVMKTGLFELMQDWYYGEAADSCLYPQDLIIPRVKFL